MPIDEGCNAKCETELPIGMVSAKSNLTKQRYVELVQLGLRASQELLAHGLLRHEYCEFGRIMEKIMQLE